MMSVPGSMPHRNAGSAPSTKLRCPRCPVEVATLPPGSRVVPRERASSMFEARCPEHGAFSVPISAE